MTKLWQKIPATSQKKNKNYRKGFGYVAPSKTKTIIVDSDGDINKIDGKME